MNKRTEIRLDKALKRNAEMEANLGIDSSKEDRETVKRLQLDNLEFLRDRNGDHYNRITANKI